MQNIKVHGTSWDVVFIDRRSHKYYYFTGRRNALESVYSLQSMCNIWQYMKAHMTFLEMTGLGLLFMPVKWSGFSHAIWVGWNCARCIKSRYHFPRFNMEPHLLAAEENCFEMQISPVSQWSLAHYPSYVIDKTRVGYLWTQPANNSTCERPQATSWCYRLCRTSHQAMDSPPPPPEHWSAWSVQIPPNRRRVRRQILS